MAAQRAYAAKFIKKKLLRDNFIPKIPYFISIDRIKELSSTLEKVSQ